MSYFIAIFQQIATWMAEFLRSWDSWDGTVIHCHSYIDNLYSDADGVRSLKKSGVWIPDYTWRRDSQDGAVIHCHRYIDNLHGAVVHPVKFDVQRLTENSRPKGLSAVPTDSDAGHLLILLMVGHLTDNSATSSVFVPSSVTADYQLSLQLHSRESSSSSSSSAAAAAAAVCF